MNRNDFKSVRMGGDVLTAGKRAAQTCRWTATDWRWELRAVSLFPPQAVRAKRALCSIFLAGQNFGLR